MRSSGSQPISTAVHRSPNKLWRSNSIFNQGERTGRTQKKKEGEEGHIYRGTAMKGDLTRWREGKRDGDRQKEKDRGGII